MDFTDLLSEVRHYKKLLGALLMVLETDQKIVANEVRQPWIAKKMIELKLMTKKNQVCHLFFKSVENVVEHHFQFRMWILPGSNGVTKVNEVVCHSQWVDIDHLTHAPDENGKGCH